MTISSFSPAVSTSRSACAQLNIALSSARWSRLSTTPTWAVIAEACVDGEYIASQPRYELADALRDLYDQLDRLGLDQPLSAMAELEILIDRADDVEDALDEADIDPDLWMSARVAGLKRGREAGLAQGRNEGREVRLPAFACARCCGAPQLVTIVAARSGVMSSRLSAKQ